MSSLAEQLSDRDLSLAESLGAALAEENDTEEQVAIGEQYDALGPNVQIYAQYKRMELDALRSIARDLEMNVPRTDYTAVKDRIASGNATLESVISELPVSWQEIRTLNEKVERPNIAGKPPTRERLHVMFMTRDQGLLEDKRAEKDGDWIISDKYGFEVPYQRPADIYGPNNSGQLSAWKGKAVIITHDATSEWETEFWRQGGRMDQVYIRAKRGMSPEQLLSAYNRQRIKRTGWVFAGIMLVVDIIILIATYL